MKIKPVLVPDQDAATLRKLMNRFAEVTTGPTRQELTESRAAVAAAPGVTEAAKWRTHPDAHDHDTDGSPMPKGGIKSDPLATRQGASRTQSEKDPKSLAGKFGDKYAKKHGVPTKQLMKNIPLDDIDEKSGVAEARPDVMRHRGDKTIKIVKRAGKPIGEIGIDEEASEGNGQYYVKLYDGSYDAVGYDTAEEALAELKYAIKSGVAEGASMSNHSKIMGLIRTYYDSMGRDFWPWFNEPGNKEFFARRINVSPEEAYEVVDSMDWGQVPHEDDDEDMKEGWKQKVAGAALAGAAALGAGGAQAQSTDKYDPTWGTSGYDTHIRSDKSLTRSMNSADPSKDVNDFQRRIQSVTGPNAKGEYKVVVIQGDDIVSHYVTKTPPPGWLYKEDAESVTEAGRRQPGRPKFTLYPSYHAWRLELMRRGDDQIDHLDNDYVDNYRVLFALDRNRRVVGMYYRTADTGTFVPPGQGFSDMIYYADTDPHWPYSDDDGKEDLREGALEESRDPVAQLRADIRRFSQ